MTPEIVPAIAAHIPVIAERTRAADRAEFWALACQAPEQVMGHALRSSKLAWTGLIDGVPVCMFGVVSASILGDVGRPWMVGTDHLDRHPFVFLRRCKGCVADMLAAFSTLENYVDQRNARAIEWLQWLGFDLNWPGQPMGPYGLPFIRFEMRR